MNQYNILHCTDSYPNLLGLFDTTIAPDLLFYAYIPVALLTLVVGIFILKSKNTFSLPNKIFFWFTIVYVIYLLNEIFQWIAYPASFVHFSWQIVALLFIALSFLLLYFVYIFIDKKDITFTSKFILAVLIAPVLFLLPTDINMSSFNVLECEPQTGILFYYIYLLIGLASILIVYKCLSSYLSSKKIENIYIMLGSLTMMVVLLFSDAISEYTGKFELNLIGPIGMLVLISTLSYIIVKFHAFNIKLIGAQALVVALIFLVGSQYFFVTSVSAHILVVFTFILTCVGGVLLTKSVRKEVEQREQIEELAENLSKANERLKVLDKMKSEFVSIASHQLRGPITSIRGYASMLSEGSYGKLPEKATEVLNNIVDSSKFMALSIEDYLNVSRIEAGNMKYEMADFNLKETAERIVDEMRAVALKKGLAILFRSDCTGSATIHADIGKTRQVIMNLIDNSIKYTQKGTITVTAHDDLKKKKMCITITDTGVGMSKETQSEVFDKFVRAKNANQVNVTGTGLGLYVAKKMTDEMGGKVWAESEGEGKGSSFHVEFPMIGGKSNAKV